MVSKDFARSIQVVKTLEDGIAAVRVLHLPGYVLGEGAFLVEVLEGSQSCPRADLNRLAVVSRNSIAGFHLGISFGAGLRGAAYWVVRIFKIDGHFTHIPVPWPGFLPPGKVPGGLIVQTG